MRSKEDRGDATIGLISASRGIPRGPAWVVTNLHFGGQHPDDTTKPA